MGLPNFVWAYKKMIAVVFFIDSFLSSVLQVSISGVIFLTQANISRLDLGQVAQGLVRFRKLKFIGL